MILLIILGLILLYLKKENTLKLRHGGKSYNKKTDLYKLVHKTQDYCIWEPHFLMNISCQVITGKPHHQTCSEVLLISAIKSKTKDYELMGIDTESYEDLDVGCASNAWCCISRLSLVSCPLIA